MITDVRNKTLTNQFLGKREKLRLKAADWGTMEYHALVLGFSDVDCGWKARADVRSTGVRLRNQN